ncbi:MAG: hypothetical protein ACD_78C00001G0003 [uncultured bacterium (gcode 4)]|uniref:Uncharacterized protein n=1 Tax=uncultured bacterium (gcode 4) TaxID=1234023 RepID=K1XJN2_9BACT|nr:MAG: hypothetical protein ACD_78C00001G0003 [uncultured bacterium (gcode 4)]
MTKQIENIQEQNTPEARAKKVRDILVQKKVIKDAEKDMTIHYIKEWVFAWFAGKTVAGFLKENWESIIMLLPLGESPKFDQAAFLAGYREIKQNNGIYDMYHIQDINEKTGQPKPGAKPLDQTSVEYFQAWMDIGFYLSKLTIEIWKHQDSEWVFHKATEGMIHTFWYTKTLRIRDIESFLKNKQIDKKMFDQTLKTIQSQIIGQISDERFERIGDEITFDELRDYYEKGFLDKNIYERAIKTLGEVEGKRMERNKKKEALKEKTKGELKKVR